MKMRTIWNIGNFVVLFVVLMLTSAAVSAQSPCAGVVMPAGTLCITQVAGNAAAENKRELDATKEKVVTLETVVVPELNKIIDANKATADKNEADLKAALHKTETDLGTKTGQLIGAEGSIVRLTAIIDFMLKNGRNKCGVSIICIQ